MKLLFLLLAIDASRMERDLDEIARVATIMVDGDVCQRIVTPRALASIFRIDPRDQYADSDNYDVNDEAFIRTKKTLMRLSQLVDYPVDVNLWMPLPSKPPRIHVVIRNHYEMSQFWPWGKLHQEMIPEMQSVLSTGRRITVKQKPGFISVLSPVRNSLNEIVGLVEVVSRTQPDARENVQ
ncbi:MAG: hypothetical protein ABJF23_12060 [Bryobacteraceae bacterium]